jgi:hypothetical protein
MDKQFISIEELQDKIFKLGSQVMWGEIEKINNWQDRVAYRQLFFLAGGSLDD